jgi:hypothetical protein
MSERVAPRTWYTEAVIGTDADGLSNEIDGKGYRLAKIFMPSEWTAADLTFAESQKSGGTFNNLYDDSSTPAEVTIPVSASETVVVSENKDKLSAMTYFKLRSGTSTLPVQQGAERTIGLLFVGI